MVVSVNVFRPNTWPPAPVEVTMSEVTRTAKGVLLAALVSLALPSAVHAQEPAPAAQVEATLDSMRGGQRTLSAERGHRIVVLFYEDRDHVEDNSAFKGDFNRFVLDNHLDDRVVGYGVANLADVGMVPQALVRQMIAPLVDRWGSDILLDWDGVMRRAPFSFPTAATTCAIIDRSGAIIYRYTGVIDETQRRAFYRALRGALAH
jgi:hypothetical protein